MNTCAQLWLMSATREQTASNYEKVVSDLVEAVALDPGNDRVLGNLEGIYEQMLQQRIGSQTDLAQKRDAVKRIRTAVAAGKRPGG